MWHPIALIFDMDGLIIDTEQIAREMYTRTIADCGFRFDDTLLPILLGRRNQDVERILTATFGPDFDVEYFRGASVMHWNDIARKQPIRVKAGVGALLNDLDALGVRRAVATSTSSSDAVECLRTVGLLGRFNHVVGGEAVVKGKPAPDLFIAAAARLRMRPEQCLVLEDAPIGVQAAVAANMRVIMIPDLVDPPPEIATKCTIVPNLEAVRSILPSLLGGWKMEYSND